MLIDTQTRVLGLVGAKLAHSLSPLMQNKALDILGENYIYVAFEVAPDNLEAAIQGIRALGIAGLNVTVPYKQRVMPLLDDLDISARECGAVNVIANREGRLTGYNTDGAGFVLGLQDAGGKIPETTLLIGAGGAARAVAMELAKCGTRRFDILDVNPSSAASLGQLLKMLPGVETSVQHSGQEMFDLMAPRAQLIINCSPVGMYPEVDASPVAGWQAAAPGTMVCDLIYNPLETRFLRMAREQGLPVMNGVAMLACQGALSLEIWMGKTAPRHEMHAALLEALKEVQAS